MGGTPSMGSTLRRDFVRQDFCQTRWAPIRLFFCWCCSPGHPNRASASLIIMEGHIQQSILQQSIMEQSIMQQGIMEQNIMEQQSIMEGHTEGRQLSCLTVVLSERSVPSSHQSVRCSSLE